MNTYCMARLALATALCAVDIGTLMAADQIRLMGKRLGAAKAEALHQRGGRRGRARSNVRSVHCAEARVSSCSPAMRRIHDLPGVGIREEERIGMRREEEQPTGMLVDEGRKKKRRRR
jgi:hypothetical protein